MGIFRLFFQMPGYTITQHAPFPVVEYIGYLILFELHQMYINLSAANLHFTNDLGNFSVSVVS